jgi:cytoskeletal protein CcmA (bactofilin family)
MSESPITKQTVLEEGTEVEGSIRSQCPITVSGTLKGDIAAPSLTITLSGSVHGQVKVSNFKSEGETAAKLMPRVSSCQDTLATRRQFELRPFR